MKKIINVIILALFIIPSMSFAGCGTINIVITNASSNLCKLESSELKHGYFDYVSSAPIYIPPHFSANPIVLSQSFLGSELELTYICGNDRKITLLNLHHYDFFAAGNVEGHVIYSKNMKAENHSLMGSCLWNQHGTLDWLIE